MIHFKHHKSGFSVIEVMFALVLLSIAGTSLFMMQSTIFNQTSKSHNKVIGQLYINQLYEELLLKVFQKQQQKQSPKNISLKKTVKQPMLETTLTLKNIPEKSSLFKPFAEHVQIIQQVITSENKEYNSIRFIFFPDVTDEQQSELEKNS